MHIRDILKVSPDTIKMRMIREAKERGLISKQHVSFRDLSAGYYMHGRISTIDLFIINLYGLDSTDLAQFRRQWDAYEARYFGNFGYRYHAQKVTPRT